MKKTILASLGVLLVTLMLVTPVLAAEDFEIENPLGENATSIPTLINRVANFIFFVGIVVAPVMILVAAFYFLTAGGNKDRVTKARKIIIWTLVGVAVLYMSNILMDVIQQVLGVNIT